MAKNEEKAAEAATTTEETKAASSHMIIVKVPATAAHPYTVDSFAEALKGETKDQPRSQFIKEYAKTGNYTRSDLTAFTRLAQGLKADDKSLKYQIIFQATKDIDKSVWPKKAEAPAESKEEAAAEA